MQTSGTVHCDNETDQTLGEGEGKTALGEEESG